MAALLSFIGFGVVGAIKCFTDNKGAHDLCHRFTSAANSRHVDRKLFKMRELRGAGFVNVNWIGTDDNPADLFTKVLGRQPFERHRRTVLNLAAGEKVESMRAAREKYDPTEDSCECAFALGRFGRAFRPGGEST